LGIGGLGLRFGRAVFAGAGGAAGAGAATGGALSLSSLTYVASIRWMAEVSLGRSSSISSDRDHVSQACTATTSTVMASNHQRRVPGRNKRRMLRI
jgi:hypothetical protein